VPCVVQHDRAVEVEAVQLAECVKQVPLPQLQCVEKPVPRIELRTTEKIVEVPQILQEEVCVEVPHVQLVEKIRQVPEPTVQQVVKEVPKIEMKYLEKVIQTRLDTSMLKQTRQMVEPCAITQTIMVPPPVTVISEAVAEPLMAVYTEGITVPPVTVVSEPVAEPLTTVCTEGIAKAPLTVVSEPIAEPLVPVVAEGIQGCNLFDAIDRNHDGVITQGELAAAVNDGTITIYTPGTVVEYWHEAQGGWITAEVISWNVESRCYVLDSHPSIPAAKVRIAAQ